MKKSIYFAANGGSPFIPDSRPDLPPAPEKDLDQKEAELNHAFKASSPTERVNRRWLLGRGSVEDAYLV